MGKLSLYVPDEFGIGQDIPVIPRPVNPAMVWMVGPVIGRHRVMSQLLILDPKQCMSDIRDMGYPDHYVKLWKPDDGYDELLSELKQKGLFERHDFIQIKLPHHAEDAFLHEHDADTCASKMVSQMRGSFHKYNVTVRLWVEPHNKKFIQALDTWVKKGS